jgi:hypothetical protein
MPCYTEPESPGEIEDRIRKDCRHNSEVAAMLCAILKAVSPSNHVVFGAHPGISLWWSEHVHRDKEKAREAEKRKQAVRDSYEKELRTAQEQVERLQRKIKGL